MNSQGSNVSDDPQTICRGSSSQLSAIDELLLNIPIDLVFEIFSRLPLKSIARCRCVSKQWSSVLRRSDFTELFLAKSLSRPQLLFASKEEEGGMIFLSSPQRQNFGENVSTIATVDHRMAVPFENVKDVSLCVNGYFCITDDRMSKGRETEEEEYVYVICNPSTGQCLTLPKINTTREVSGMRTFLGYDPIEKQHKVLAMIWHKGGALEPQVLTSRGNGNMTWRLIECGIQHSFAGPGYICISGVLYYIAKASSGEYMIACFDVRSEKFSSVKAMEIGSNYETLVNFQGKLASLTAQPDLFYPDPYFINGTSTSFEIWILQDPEKHEWSKRIFNLPPMWKDVVGVCVKLYFIGATDTNEFVMAPIFSSGSFNVYYYNFVKESIRRVEIQGIEAFETTGSIVHTYVNHVEDVKLM